MDSTAKTAHPAALAGTAARTPVFIQVLAVEGSCEASKARAFLGMNDASSMPRPIGHTTFHCAVVDGCVQALACCA